MAGHACPAHHHLHPSSCLAYSSAHATVVAPICTAHPLLHQYCSSDSSLVPVCTFAPSPSLSLLYVSLSCSRRVAHSLAGTDAVDAFVKHDGAEGIVAAFFDNLGRRISVLSREGVREVVQVVPRGGWFKRLYTYMSEVDLRLLRAIFVTASEDVVPSLECTAVAALLKSESCPQDLYANVHAVAVSLFVRMAFSERGPHGRARCEPPVAPSLATFIRSGMTIPKAHVVALAKLAMSYSMSQKLAALEADRVQKGCRSAMVLSHCPSTTDYLWHIDGQGGLLWQPANTSMQTEVGARLVQVYGCLHLKEFGWRELDTVLRAPRRMALCNEGSRYQSAVPKALRDMCAVPKALRDMCAGDALEEPDANESTWHGAASLAEARTLWLDSWRSALHSNGYAKVPVSISAGDDATIERMRVAIGLCCGVC